MEDYRTVSKSDQRIARHSLDTKNNTDDIFSNEDISSGNFQYHVHIEDDDWSA